MGHLRLTDVARDPCDCIRASRYRRVLLDCPAQLQRHENQNHRHAQPNDHNHEERASIDISRAQLFWKRRRLLTLHFGSSHGLAMRLLYSLPSLLLRFEVRMVSANLASSAMSAGTRHTSMGYTFHISHLAFSGCEYTAFQRGALCNARIRKGSV